MTQRKRNYTCLYYCVPSCSEVSSTGHRLGSSKRLLRYPHEISFAHNLIPFHPITCRLPAITTLSWLLHFTVITITRTIIRSPHGKLGQSCTRTCRYLPHIIMGPGRTIRCKYFCADGGPTRTEARPSHFSNAQPERKAEHINGRLCKRYKLQQPRIHP